jgi:hypothetical protein
MGINFLNTSDLVSLIKSGGLSVHVTILSQEIEDLKKELAGLDYKTIKNTQYERMAKELPYSWEDLYNESEAIRIQIREKEQEILNLMGLITPVEEIKE